MTNPLELNDAPTSMVSTADVTANANQTNESMNPLGTITGAELIECTEVAETRVQQLEEEAHKFLNEVFERYQPHEVMMAFNGGKDCTVLLDLMSRYFASNQCLKNHCLSVLYVESEEPFEEVEAVVKECVQRYNINLVRRKGDMKSVLYSVLNEFQHVKAVFMGSRKTDPYCNDLGLMKQTDPGWPQLMRICPIIDWSYQDVWYYIFMRQVPYCKLYQNGYTSLGSKTNTQPNPHLRVVDPITNAITYRHAAELRDGKYERAGRNLRANV